MWVVEEKFFLFCKILFIVMMDMVGKHIIIFKVQVVIVLLLVEVKLLKYLKEKNFTRLALEGAVLCMVY